MPPAFEFYTARNDIWLPLTIDPTAWFHRGGISMALGRLKPRASFAQATAELETIVPSMRAEIGASVDYGKDARVVGLVKGERGALGQVDSDPFRASSEREMAESGLD